MQRFNHFTTIYRRFLTRVMTPTIILGALLISSLLFGTAPSYAQTDALTGKTGQGNVTAGEVNEVFNAAVAVPVHESPEPDSVSTALSAPPVGVPTLTWVAVPGATRYNVQISVSEGFASTIISQDTVATSFTPPEAFADGTYFWRVRAEVDRAWGNYSDPWSFRKEWSAEGLIKPLLIAPANDPDGLQVITEFSPEHFSWHPVPGAAAYYLDISVSPSFNDAKPFRVTTLKTHHTPTEQFANNQYYWRVIPIDARDHAGEPSDIRTFTFGWNQIPTLLEPADDLDARFIPRFTWSAVSGASSYVIEISSQENFSDLLVNVTTRNTSYTPEKSLANNKDYFWRVRAISPRKVNGPTSEVRSFRSNWIQPPTLLSPPVRSIHHIYPYFSWSPVPGAQRYQIQIATGNGFADLVEDKKLYGATSYTQPEWKEIVFGGDYFWRVRAEDAQGNTTNWSSEQSFRFAASPPPNLIYPEPYYIPDAEGMPIHTERVIAHPVFVWDTTHQYNVTEENLGNGPTAFIYPDYYRLEVATSSEFSTIIFSIDSAGQGAAPTLENPIDSLVDDTLYYWRVTPFLNGTPMAAGTVWETRIDRTAEQLPLDSDSTPDISHPQDGMITVETAPILGWLPVEDAHHYRVEVGNNRDLNNSANLVDTANALFAYYVPWQGRQTPMPPGAYWWRVRAEDESNTALGEWSETRHFFVTDNLMTGNEYDYKIPNYFSPDFQTLLNEGDTRLYDPALSMVATDSITVAAPYNVGPLHVVQDRSAVATNRNWVVAFSADNGVVGELTYALYFDVNQKENVGGTTDPRGKPISFDSLYLPDYVIYLSRLGDAITNAIFYEWTGNAWIGSQLDGLGGTYFYDEVNHAVQVIFPYSTIILSNEDQFSGAVALTVYSTGSADNAGPEDSMPHQGATMNSPALFSNMPVPLFPFDTPLSNPIVFHELPTLRWRMPHYNSTDGYRIEVARNPNFTEDTIIETWETTEGNTGSYYGGAPTAFHSYDAYNDDESYYWRVRYRHERYDGGNEYDVSPWSPPMRFKLTSYQPGNPTIALTDSDDAFAVAASGATIYATPSFTWQRVEGAARYTIQIDDDFNMNSPITNKTIDANSYTSLDTLADGTYYWRVAMRRTNNVLGQWTSVISFTKSSFVPVLVGPIDSVVVNGQPTFIWEPTIVNEDGLHIAAARYRLQWDDNPQFNSPTTIETEATSYTPLKGQSLNDGTWFWRVAVIDGQNKRGPDSPAATFYKEYLRPETVSPVQGSTDITNTSITFEWTPLDGAAYYKLEIDDDEAFDRAKRISTDNSRYTLTDKLDVGQYYWRVQMVDKDNKPGPTITGQFTQDPDAPIEDSPALFMPFVLGP